MAINRLYDRDTTQTSPGTKLDADIDQTNNAFNAHEALVVAHGATGANVGTTNTQTLSNKTLATPTIQGGIKQSALNREAVIASVTLNVNTVIAGVTSLAANRTLTIPSAQITTAGREWYIVDETGTCGATYKIIIATEGAETINGEATLEMYEPNGRVHLYSDGTNLLAD